MKAHSFRSSKGISRDSLSKGHTRSTPKGFLRDIQLFVANAKFRLLLLLFPVLCTGCFDLVEEVNVHADGSGSYAFEANLSQSKTRLNTIMALDSLDGFKIPSKEQIGKDLERAKKVLEASPGISKVDDKTDFDNYIFSLRFDFINIKFLNAALLSLHKSFDPGHSIPPKDGFRLDGKIFERINEYKVPHEIDKVPKKELALLNDAFLTCIYRFDQAVVSFSNADAKLSKNGKAILLKLSVPEVLKGTKNISDIIQIKTEP